MLTPRELAASEYHAAMAQGRSRPLGVDRGDMVSVTEERVRKVRSAERVIRAAQATERHFIREPDDALLARMLAAVAQLVDTLEVDCTRWAQPREPDAASGDDV